MKTVFFVLSVSAGIAFASGCLEKERASPVETAKPAQIIQQAPAQTVTQPLIITPSPASPLATPAADKPGKIHVPLLQTKALAPVPIRPLKIEGEKFVDDSGKVVNFWGVNLVSFYPKKEIADKTAANLASLGINMVRPHHCMRPSKDWNYDGPFALAKYNGNSRDMDMEAWDRFDYLNAKLREKGIYLALAIWWSRSYQPTDVDIKKISATDDKAWSDAMKELNSWDWRKSFDPRKLLPIFDERSFLLNAEFAKFMLTRVNKYSGLTYGKDPQVMSLEYLNECDPEYILICKNVFPEYFKKEFESKLNDFAVKKGVKPFDLYKMANDEQKRTFSEFCSFLIQDFSKRMTQAVREYGYQGPVMFSNLWESEPGLNARSITDNYIEDHLYGDPFPVGKKDDMFYEKTKGVLKGKPFIIGEMNMSENQDLIKKLAPVRSMLQFAVSAYGSLQDWAGVTWFAWNHGSRDIADDGWGKDMSRKPSIGTVCGDGVFLDHCRTTGIIFRNGYFRGSTAPITLVVDEPYFPSGYQDMVRGKYIVKPGWQSIHKVRKAYGQVPAEQKTAEWMTASSSTDVIISDTGEIIKDMQRKQLTAYAPKAEGFSGYLDSTPPAGLKVIGIKNDTGFATVVLVPLDDLPIVKSSHLLLSRTYTVADGSESDALNIVLNGLPANSKWCFRPTRTRETGGEKTVSSIKTAADGSLVLPSGNWTESEIELE
jgi:hypothetical protein